MFSLTLRKATGPKDSLLILPISFEKVSGRDLKWMFDEWLLRTGAPKLKLRDVAATPDKNGYLLTGLIGQVQSGKTCRLLIPLAVTMFGKKEAYQTSVVMDKGIPEFSLHVHGRQGRCCRQSGHG